MAVQFKGWEFEVDRQHTQRIYEKVEKGAAQTCGCRYCQNFLLQQETVYPLDLIDLFELLGIDYHKESDVSEYGELENGLHIYISCFHFAGKIVNGESSALALPAGGYQLNLTPITEKIKIGFWVNDELSHFTNETFLVQLELEVHLPWLLDAEIKRPSGLT